MSKGNADEGAKGCAHCSLTDTRTSYSSGASGRRSFRLGQANRAQGGQIQTATGDKMDGVDTYSRAPKPGKAALPPTQTMLAQNMPLSSSGNDWTESRIDSANPA